MGVEFLILTIYFICVIYVLYQMALSVEDKLEDQFAILLDGEGLQAAVNAQLQQQTLYMAEAEMQTVEKFSLLKITFFEGDEAIGTIGVKVTPQGKRPLQPPIQTLSVSIANTLPDQQVFLEWDRSAISVHGGSAQRVIRQVPGNTTNLLPSQAPTTVNPGLQASVTVTAESLFTRNDNQIALEVGPALVDLAKIPGMKEPLRQYTLQTVLWVRSLIYPGSPALQLVLPFNFRIEVLPDRVALPVLSWLLNFNPFALGTSAKSR
ncbi:MAG: hypothetical protein AAGF98_15045 [Cyanobacteria bacterium P01_H01_bin.153]